MAFPQWSVAGDLMRFDGLDALPASLPVYVIAWRIVDDPDVWSHRLLGFKTDGTMANFNGGAWCLKRGVECILEDQGWAAEHTGLITALSSSDTNPSEKHVLYRTGKWIAEHLKLTFLTPHLTKEPHRSLHGLGGAGERDAEVEGKYTCAAFDGIAHVVILDDLVTRGATFKELARAVHAASGIKSFAALAVGKNEKRRYANYCGATLNNDHVSKEMETLWKRAEERFK